MTAPPQSIIRPAQTEDEEALDALGMASQDAERLSALVVERDGAIMGVGAVDPLGTPTEPEHPVLRLHWANATTPEERCNLLRALIEQARALGATRLLVTSDPMDHHGLTVLETVGFRPTGRGPYINLGGGTVQYVTGYTDASGSMLDCAMDLM